MRENGYDGNLSLNASGHEHNSSIGDKLETFCLTLCAFSTSSCKTICKSGPDSISSLQLTELLQSLQALEKHTPIDGEIGEVVSYHLHTREHSVKLI